VSKVLLLNLPSDRYTFSRDYFCSKVIKGSYIEHPVDFIVLSGILAAEGHEPILFDATVQHLNQAHFFEGFKKQQVEYIIFLTGTVSWENDKEYLIQIRELLPDVVLIGIGDIFFNRKIFDLNKWIDAVVYDFTNHDIINFLAGRLDIIANMAYRENGVSTWPVEEQDVGAEFEIPIPKHELFLPFKYTFPFVRRLPFTTVLTDYGCPFTCSFCQYSRLVYKYRNTENVMNELKYMYSLGIREIFFKDQTFGGSQKRIIELCEGMIAQRFAFGWTAFMRIDLISPKILRILKEAGCHTLIVGIEAANQEIIQNYNKGFGQDTVRNALDACRKEGIDSVATFMLGLPKETDEDMKNTISYALSLDPDFASFNIFVPKEEIIQRAHVEGLKTDIRDQSGIVLPAEISPEKETIISNHAKAIKRFYFRPLYLLKRILKTRTFAQCKMLWHNCLGIIRMNR